MTNVYLFNAAEKEREKAAAYLKANGFRVCLPSVSGEADGVAALFLKKEEETRFAEKLCQAGLGVVVLAEKKTAAAAEQKLAGTGVLVLARPVSGATLAAALKLAAAVGERLRTLDEENGRLRRTISDLKLIDRAKCALIQYLGMSEKTAHRFIEKQAMDRRIPRRDVALEILKAYES